MISRRCQMHSLYQSRLLIVVTLTLLLAVPTLASVPKIISLSQDPIYSIRTRADFESERLVYEFRLGPIPAAKAEWTATRRTVNGKTVLKVRGKAKTLKPLAVFWKMRGTVKATVGADPILPHYFILSKRENSRRRDITLNFDHQSGIIKIIRIGKHRTPRKYTGEITGQYDPVSAAFAFRGLSLGDGKTVQIDVQPGKSVYRLDMQVLGREQVTIKAGTFNAIVLSVSIYNLTKDEPCTDLKRTKVWVSDDPKRIALKAETKVSVGLVYAELVSWQ